MWWSYWWPAPSQCSAGLSLPVKGFPRAGQIRQRAAANESRGLVKALWQQNGSWREEISARSISNLLVLVRSSTSQVWATIEPRRVGGSAGSAGQLRSPIVPKDPAFGLPLAQQPMLQCMSIASTHTRRSRSLCTLHGARELLDQEIGEDLDPLWSRPRGGRDPIDAT
jgi:hypothetical protein